MTVKTLDQQNPQADKFDIITMLAERLTDAELQELKDENARYREAQKKRNVSAGGGAKVRTQVRNMPQNFRRLQTAIKAQDCNATDAAWDSCENWMIADVSDVMPLNAANELDCPGAWASRSANVCAARSAWLH